MAYIKPPQYTPDWERIRNIINGYQSGYRPTTSPRDYSLYNYDASLMPVETLPIPEEESVPSVEFAPLPQGETSLDTLVYDNDKSLDKFKGSTGGGMSKNPMSYLQAAGDLASMGMDIYNSSKSQVALPAYTNYHVGNVNSMVGYNMMRQGPMLSHNLAHKQTTGEVVGDTLTKTAKGALDGLSVGGPWGALAGAVIGLGMGIGNAATKGATHRKDIAKINYFNDVQRDNYRRAKRQALGNIQAQRNMGINYQRHMNTYGLGGTVEPSELMHVTQFNTGGTHEGNPYGGVPIGVGENGKPNLVEEGEVRWKDFIFSKRVKPAEEVLKKYNTYMKGGFESYADLANKILELHKEREDSPFDKAAMNTQMQRLADAQEWQKMADEAAENGMTPEEYTEYLQYAQKGQQFAMGGNVFADGGETGDDNRIRNIRDRKGEDKLPTHGNTTKDYYEANKGGNAYYIEKFLDAYYAFNGDSNGHNQDVDFSKKQMGLREENGKKVTYSFGQLQELYKRMEKILKEDPDAIYYMYCRMDEINKVKRENPQDFAPYYDMGAVISSLGVTEIPEGGKFYKGSDIFKEPHSESKFLNKAKNIANKVTKVVAPVAASPFIPAAPIISAGKELTRQIIGAFNNDRTERATEADYSGTNIVDPLSQITAIPYNGKRYVDPLNPNFNAEKQTQGVNTLQNTIQASIDRYNNPSAHKTAVPDTLQSTPTASATIPYNGYSDFRYENYGGGSKYPTANWYQGPEWKDFVKNRENPDVLQAFTDKFNADNGKKYSPEYIKKKLSDNDVGPIHKAFMDYIKPVETKVAQAAPTNTSEGTPEEKAASVATTAANNNTSNTSDTTTQNNPNKLGFSPYDAMRLAPIFDSLRSVLEQDKPDYTYANQLASLYRPVTYRPVGQYARYMSIDQHYLDTMARQQQNTLYGYYRQNAMSPAAANYYATLANTMTGSQAAHAYRDSVLQNNQSRNSVLAMNNQIDTANEAARARAQQINYQNYANIMAQSYAAAEQERLAVEQAREANKQNLANKIGTLGRELSDRYYVANNPALSYGPMGSYYKWLQDELNKQNQKG